MTSKAASKETSWSVSGIALFGDGQLPRWEEAQAALQRALADSCGDRAARPCRRATLESDPPGLEDLSPGNPVTEGQNQIAKLPSVLRHGDLGIIMVCCVKPQSFGVICCTTVDN